MANRRGINGGFPPSALVPPSRPSASGNGTVDGARFAAGRGSKTLRQANEPRWWLRTGQFAAGTLIVGATLTLAPLLAPERFGNRLMLGLPLGVFLATIAAPVLVLVLVALFASRQRALDRRYDVAEH